MFFPLSLLTYLYIYIYVYYYFVYLFWQMRCLFYVSESRGSLRVLAETPYLTNGADAAGWSCCFRQWEK